MQEMESDFPFRLFTWERDPDLLFILLRACKRQVSNSNQRISIDLCISDAWLGKWAILAFRPRNQLVNSIPIPFQPSISLPLSHSHTRRLDRTRAIPFSV